MNFSYIDCNSNFMLAELNIFTIIIQNIRSYKFLCNWIVNYF